MNFSVVIPTILRDSLPLCIESVNAQRLHADVEIITEFDAHQIGCQSISKARNMGVSKSKYDTIAFIDDDDTWNDGYLDITQGMRLYDVIITNSAEHGFCGKNIEQMLLHGESPTGCSGLIIKKRAFMEIGGFNESLMHSEVYDILLRLLLRGYSFYHRNIPLWIRGIGDGYHAGKKYRATDIHADRLNMVKRLCATS